MKTKKKLLILFVIVVMLAVIAMPFGISASKAEDGVIIRGNIYENSFLHVFPCGNMAQHVSTLNRNLSRATGSSWIGDHCDWSRVASNNAITIFRGNRPNRGSAFYALNSAPVRVNVNNDTWSLGLCPTYRWTLVQTEHSTRFQGPEFHRWTQIGWW